MIAILCLLLASACLSSCQTLHGMGSDLDHLGKSLTAPLQKKPLKNAPAQNRISPMNSKASQAPPKTAIPKEGHTASSKGLGRLQPELFKEGIFSARETPEPLSLGDLPTKTDIQEVPQPSGPWIPGAVVDVNGDGIPEWRYRQRVSAADARQSGSGERNKK